MSVGTMERSMGRKKSEKPRNDVTAKLDAEIVRKARLIVADSGESMAELFSRLLKEPIDSLYAELTAKLGRESKSKR